MNDHIVDAATATPRTDADLWSFPGPMKVDGGINVYVRASTSRTLERELTVANAEIARLKAGGCARDQRTTQWCAEAVELARKLEEANTRIAVLEVWIRSLEDIEFNPSEHRRWCGDPIGWLNPGHAVFVGKDKPESLR